MGKVQKRPNDMSKSMMSESKTFANLDISVRNIKKVQDITYKERVHGANKDNGSTGESPALLLERNEDTQI